MLAIVVLAIVPLRVHAESREPTRTTYGEVGLLETPSAQMAPDGELAITISALRNTQRYNLSFQILPWFEGVFRYSHVAHWEDNGNPLYDRSLGFKMRLLEETDYLPTLSLGVRDLLGTGAYSSEYFVATKHIGDFEVTAGMGWGRLADRPAFRNPLALVFSSFADRSAANTATGGTVAFNKLFHGKEVGVFGGIDWSTPINGLDLMVEYSPDQYQQETIAGGFKVANPFNFGVAYRPLESISMSAGWYYGTTYGLAVTVHFDPKTSMSPQHFGPPAPMPSIRTSEQQQLALSTLLGGAKFREADRSAANRPWWIDPSQPLLAALMTSNPGVRDVEISGDMLIINAHEAASQKTCGRYVQTVATVDPHILAIAVTDLNNGDGQVELCQVTHPNATRSAPDQASRAEELSVGEVLERVRQDLAGTVEVDALSFDHGQLWLYYTNNHYYSEAEAAGRIARILMGDAPPSVEIFRLIAIVKGMPVREFRIARTALERAAGLYATAREFGDALSFGLPPLSNPILDAAWSRIYPKLHWNIGPGLRESFFDPARPLQVHVLAALNADVELMPSLELDVRLEANIYNDYNVLLRSDSLLPHVRSDAVEYFRHGINGISTLAGVYHTRLTRDVYAEIKAGYLEDMFAGVGAQVLWRPEGARYSFGVDVYEVWQRDFNRLFGLQRYHVLTGHASLYYESPWYDLNFNVHVGRYLAGDYGATFEISRRFSTGVEVGAFATFTNVPFTKFGEGSFDKGLFFRIPFEWGLPFYSRSTYDVVLRSLTRDGGQRLLNDDSLHDELSSLSLGTIRQHVDDITNL